VYSSCSFDADTLALEFGGPQQGKTTVTIKENRS
jgi:hypothetical protein